MLLAAFLLGLCGAYRTGELRRPEVELERCVKAVAAFFILSTLIDPSLRPSPFSIASAALASLLALILLLCARYALRSLTARLWRAGVARRKSILIGTSLAVADFHSHLAIQRDRSYEILAEIVCPDRRADSDGPALSDRIENLRETVLRAGADVAILPTAGLPFEALNLAAAATRLGIDVELRSPVLSTRSSIEIDTAFHCLRFRVPDRWSLRGQQFCKTLLDLAFGLAGSAIALMIAPLIWILLKLEDGGPLFHRREYVGCDNAVRSYLKFRTMVQDADRRLQESPELQKQFAGNHKLRNDPRILKIGRIMRKFSIDEFPQFFSVLAGRLTFVGPRVISQAETARYGAALATRQSVKPGMTGYWQVMGRQNTTYDERILMDLFYVEHWSIWLDLVIIGETFRKFFAPEGAF